jgi:hypothetical protein
MSRASREVTCGASVSVVSPISSTADLLAYHTGENAILHNDADEELEEIPRRRHQDCARSCVCCFCRMLQLLFHWHTVPSHACHE